MEISKLSNFYLKNYFQRNKVYFSGAAGIPDDSFEFSCDTNKRYVHVDKIISEMENAVAAAADGNVDFKYPQMFKNRIKNGEFKLGSWNILTGEFFVKNQMQALKEKFGIKNLVPFATEDNSNRVACFVIDEKNSGRIVELDAYGLPENVDVAKYDSFEEWVFKQL